MRLYMIVTKNLLVLPTSVGNVWYITSGKANQS